MMPRYVATRWNSMYRLLKFAWRYRVAIDKFTESRENGVRELELSEEEWAMVKELKTVLKVSSNFGQVLGAPTRSFRSAR